MPLAKTFALMTLLTALFLAVGFLFGGIAGMALGLVLAVVRNVGTHWYSDSIGSRMYRAKELKDEKLKRIVESLAQKAGIPVPKLYQVAMEVPNAFATGRSPKHAAVAVTTGLMKTLSEKEVRGVLAHEISHIKNRDTLIGTLAATMAGALSWFAYIFYFGSDERNAVSAILLFIVVPIAALLIRLAITRTREYAADETGALLSNPMDLAKALEKIAGYAKARPLRGNSATSHLFIINPFSAHDLGHLFATHPPVEKRIERLEAMAKP